MNASPLFLHFVILHGTPNFDSGGGEWLPQGGGLEMCCPALGPSSVCL